MCEAVGGLANGRVTWLTERDVQQMFRASGELSERECMAKANEFWERDCFPVNFYAIDGRKLTAAGAFAAWIRMGLTREQCEVWLRGYRRSGEKDALTGVLRAQMLARHYRLDLRGRR